MDEGPIGERVLDDGGRAHERRAHGPAGDRTARLRCFDCHAAKRRRRRIFPMRPRRNRVSRPLATLCQRGRGGVDTTCPPPRTPLLPIVCALTTRNRAVD